MLCRVARPDTIARGMRRLRGCSLLALAGCNSIFGLNDNAKLGDGPVVVIDAELPTLKLRYLQATTEKVGTFGEPATNALRAQMRTERGPVPLFDRGFESIDELKARCLDETGLPPPQQPQFSERALARNSAATAEAGVSSKRRVKHKAA